jgi:hypothetical protein
MPHRVVTAALATTCAAHAVAAPVLVGDYLFQDRFANAIDGAAGSLSRIGAQGFYETRSVAGVSRRVYTFPAGSGFSLTHGIDVLQEGFSFAFLFELDATDDYRKILDLSYRRFDAGLYVSENDVLFYDHGGRRGLSGWLVPNRWVNLVYTWTPGENGAPATIRVYADGRLEHESLDPESEGILVSPYNSFYFFIDDNQTTGEHSAGSVARMRFWHGALTPDEVAALDTVPGGGPLCAADMNGDANADVNDLLAFLGAFRDADADFNGDAETNVNDLLAFLGAFRQGC